MTVLLVLYKKVPNVGLVKLMPAVFFFLSFSGNGRLASCTTIVGFVVMMSLDVGLG